MFNPLNMDEKKILVTGASSGIGRATAVYLSKLNAKLVLLGRSKERLIETSEMLKGQGHKWFTIDLNETALLNNLFQKIVDDGVKLSGLVHSAGVAQVVPVNALSRDIMRREMDINYFSFIELVKLFSKKKYSDGGSIVGISSIAAVQAEKAQTNYSASKAAMNAAIQALAHELASKGIRINSILPGAIQTNMVNEADNKGLNVKSIVQRQILGIGEAEDVAAVCAFLLSNMSRMMTGRQVYIDCGRLPS